MNKSKRVFQIYFIVHLKEDTHIPDHDPDQDLHTLAEEDQDQDLTPEERDPTTADPDLIRIPNTSQEVANTIKEDEEHQGFVYFFFFFLFMKITITIIILAIKKIIILIKFQIILY